jgi:hypothetical protein
MTIEIQPFTEKEIDFIISNNNLNNVVRALENKELYSQFEIGSILVAKKEDGSLLQDSGIIDKFVVVYRHPLGLTFVKRMLRSGGLSQSTECINTHYFQFIIDPKLVESMLLGDVESYDVKKDYDDLKKKRDAIRRSNKKLRFKFNGEDEAYALIRAFKKGDKVYRSYSLTPDSIDEYEVLQILEKERQVGSWPKYTTIKVPYAKCKSTNPSHKWDLDIDNYMLTKLFKSRPRLVTE